MGVTNARQQTGSKREPTDMERIGILSMEIDDIDDQIAGLYALKKQKKTEQRAIRAAMREKARRGELPFREGEWE